MNEMTLTKITDESILDCGHKPSPHSDCTTGYGMIKGKTHCFECCAEIDRKQMLEDGKATLYLTSSGAGLFSDGAVSNWPGTLKFNCRVKKGRHNIARIRYDAWFVGPNGESWHGVQYGENTQIIHCRRLKKV